MKYTLKQCATAATHLSGRYRFDGDDVADMLSCMVDEVRRVRQLNRKLRHDLAFVEQRRDDAERRLREIEKRGKIYDA